MAGTQTADATGSKQQGSTGGGFKQDIHRVGQSMDTVKSDVSGLAHAAADAARSGMSELHQGAQHAVDAAKDKIDGAKDMAKETYEGAKKAASDAADSFKGVVTRNPLASIGIAVGLGLLIGMLVSRNTRS